MTVKEQLMLISKGYSRDEINAMKEAEKLENQPPKEEPPKEEPPKEEPPKEEPPKEELPKEEPHKKEPPMEDPRDDKIKEMQEEIKRLQTENVNRDNSGNNKKDTRSLFEQGVDIFKGKF